MILWLINLEVVGLNPLQAEYSQWSWEHRAFPRMVVVVAGRRIPMVKCYSQNLESGCCLRNSSVRMDSQKKGSKN
jgi:hypothetical protein